MGCKFSAKSLCVSITENVLPCTNSTPTCTKGDSCNLIPKTMFQRDVQLGRYIWFAAPKNIINLGREDPNRSACGAKYKEKTRVKGGGLTAEARAFQRGPSVQ